ncbi:hypothetical protein [Pseudomonas graminis]|uniref:hypothetical protein n=1 Tax=Pseudomonas graminis TaxID=158627 RepID=UPI003C1FF3E0
MDMLSLLLTIIVPPAIVLFAVCMALSPADSTNRIFSVFKLDTEHGLLKQGLLWMAIGGPVGLGLAFGAWIWADYNVELSSLGYRKFLEISILPLGIMSISLPLAGLVSSFHSTQQAAKQISLNKVKNNIDAFYSHRKAMIEYFSAMDDMVYFGEYSFSYKIHPVIHKRFFRGSPETGWPSLIEGSFEAIEQHIRSATAKLIPVLSGTNNLALDFYLLASNEIYIAAKGLNIKQITLDMVSTGVYVKYPDSESGYLTMGVTTKETLVSIRFIYEFYNNLCDFAGRERMELSDDLLKVLTKTEYWLEKGTFIEGLHLNEIAALIETGAATTNERHPTIIERERLAALNNIVGRNLF